MYNLFACAVKSDEFAQRLTKKATVRKSSNLCCFEVANPSLFVTTHGCPKFHIVPIDGELQSRNLLSQLQLSDLVSHNSLLSRPNPLAQGAPVSRSP